MIAYKYLAALGGNAVQAFFTSMFNDFGGQLALLFEDIKISDIFDVVIVSFLIYECIILVRNTRAAQLAKGIMFMLLSYVIASLAGMRTLTFILGAIMNFGIVVLAVVFQPELRRAIEQVGGVNSVFTRLVGRRRMDNTLKDDWKKAIATVCDAAEILAEKRTGALMVMEKNANLNEIIRTGTLMQSIVNVETIGTVFYEGSPLHDGAMVVRDGRIEAAGCFLPLSNNLEISKDMGTRHRAALGMSENSDAIVVVVSEETGIISVAKSGVLVRRLDRQNLFELLISEIIPPEQEKKHKFRLFGKKEGSQNEEKV